MNVRYLINMTAAAGLVAGTVSLAQEQEGVGSGPFKFSPLPASAACVAGGAGTFPAEQPFLLPAGFVQTVVAREGDGGTIDNWDMHTLNETGPHAGRFLFHSHEVPTNGMVSVTDLSTGETRVLAQRFTELVGEAPMKYLAGWRMQIAKQMMREGSHNIQDIATRVGYDSEAAFNRAFKRATGSPPAAWRKGAVH